jgi:hypothetical protein
MSDENASNVIIKRVKVTEATKSRSLKEEIVGYDPGMQHWRGFCTPRMWMDIRPNPTTRQKVLAFAMTSHARLGAASFFSEMDQDALDMILRFACAGVSLLHEDDVIHRVRREAVEMGKELSFRSCASQ